LKSLDCFSFAEREWRGKLFQPNQERSIRVVWRAKFSAPPSPLPEKIKGGDPAQNLDRLIG
jgi:hypothetical protein